MNISFRPGCLCPSLRAPSCSVAEMELNIVVRVWRTCYCEDGVLNLVDLNITIIGFDVFNGSFVLLLLWGRFDDDDGESMLINNAL